MIKRKNQNRQTEYNHNTTLQQKPINHKFNYRINHFNQDTESLLNRTALTHTSDQKMQNQNMQFINKENQRESKKDDSLLRRNYDYHTQYATHDINKYTKCDTHFQEDKFNLGNLSRSPLQERNKNQSILIDNTDLKLQNNTARKCDHVSFRQKKQMRTSRHNIVDNKVMAEQDLEAKYQQLWNYNQDIKNKSFRVQNKKHYESDLFQQHKPQSIIVNTRGRVDSLKEQHKELRDYSSIKKHRNDSAHSQVSHRNDSASFRKERISQDHCKTKKTSPQRKYKQGFQHIYLNQQQKLQRTQHQLHLAAASNQALPAQIYHLRDTDTKLRIVEQFSSKIGLRITQLKLSMQSMRMDRK